MEGVGGVEEHPKNDAVSSAIQRQNKEFSDDDDNISNFGPGLGRRLLVMMEGSRTAELLSTLRQLRDSLVGDEKAKSSALEQGIVENLLSALDAADAAASSDTSRIAQHIARALEYPSVRLAATTLRAIISLLSSNAVPLTGPPPPPPTPAGKGDAAEGEGRRHDCRAKPAPFELPMLMRKVAARILDEVTAGDLWTDGVRIMGVKALVALTRDGDIARSLVPEVCSSTGEGILTPILPTRGRKPDGGDAGENHPARAGSPAEPLPRKPNRDDSLAHDLRPRLVQLGGVEGAGGGAEQQGGGGDSRCSL
eukprot:jgi/Undpi1/8275/HiC_scaffold_25.g10744.m1